MTNAQCTYFFLRQKEFTYVTSHTRFVTHLGSGEYFFSGWLLVEHITVTVTAGKEKKEEKERKRD